MNTLRASVALLVAVVGAMYMLPVETVLRSGLIVPHLTAAAHGNATQPAMTAVDDLLPLVNAAFDTARGFPLVITPAGEEAAAWTTEELVAWLGEHEEWLRAKLLVHGGVLLRGFRAAVATAQDFEAVSLQLEPRLEEVYLGTSPRRLMPGCRFVHTASEFPGWRIIAAHCEMSFLAAPPRRIFFYAHAPNAGPGGETPLIDFRQVYRDLDDDVRARFEAKRVRYIRWYYDERTGGSWDPFQTKSWQAMFSTNDTGVAAAKSAEQGFDVEWEVPASTGPDGEAVPPRGSMKLTHTMDPVRVHPATGDRVWHNHMNVLHATADEAEFAFSAQHLRSWKYAALHHITSASVAVRRWLWGDEAIGHHTTHAGGEPISEADADHIRAAVWRNTRIHRHQAGDVVMLDNWRLGHARQPFSGPRTILTTWA